MPSLICVDNLLRVSFTFSFPGLQLCFKTVIQGKRVYLEASCMNAFITLFQWDPYTPFVALIFHSRIFLPQKSCILLEKSLRPFMILRLSTCLHPLLYHRWHTWYITTLKPVSGNSRWSFSVPVSDGSEHCHSLLKTWLWRVEGDQNPPHFFWGCYSVAKAYQISVRHVCVSRTLWWDIWVCISASSF